MMFNRFNSFSFSGEERVTILIYRSISVILNIARPADVE